MDGNKYNKNMIEKRFKTNPILGGNGGIIERDGVLLDI